MTKDDIVTACETLELEDMAYVRRKLQEMIYRESGRLHQERMASLCKHTHVVDKRVGQREDQVQRVCVACHKVVG
jgi:tetrahydromethanopterin S-methyltransferase subunit A